MYLRKDGKHIHRSKGEAAARRPLTSKECVHHVDLDKHNNENSNLVVCPSQSYHLLLHSRTRVLDLGGDPNTEKYCDYHKILHSRDVFSTRPSSYDGLHNMCREATNQYRKERGLNTDKFDWKARLHQQFRRVNKTKVCVL